MGQPVKLSETQLAIMRALWEAGEASTTAVHAALSPVTKQAYTTVATLLKRLDDRGVIASRREGRELIYRPLVSESDVRRSMVGDLVRNLFKGDPNALVSHLVDEKAIDEDDLDAIAQLIDQGEEKGQ